MSILILSNNPHWAEPYLHHFPNASLLSWWEFILTPLKITFPPFCISPKPQAILANPQEIWPTIQAHYDPQDHWYAHQSIISLLVTLQKHIPCFPSFTPESLSPGRHLDSILHKNLQRHHAILKDTLFFSHGAYAPSTQGFVPTSRPPSLQKALHATQHDLNAPWLWIHNHHLHIFPDFPPHLMPSGTLLIAQYLGKTLYATHHHSSI